MKDYAVERAKWERLKEVFDEALELEGAERDAYLADACAGDEALRREVEALLDAHSHTFLEQSPLLGRRSEGDDLVGSEVDAYRILERIASGGMGDVFRAEHAESGEIVAVKRLSGEMLDDPKNRLRFEQEARAAMALHHPNVVTVRELFEHSGELFLVMDYVEGRTLREVLQEGQLGTGEALHYAVEISTALVKAHELGIVHRDVKPDNVMVTPDGGVKLLDFGLVKLVEPENVHEAPTKDRRSLTLEGFVLGSASYMSPEQINGKPIDGRSDVFSVGAILYEMLSGRRAFTGETAVEIVSSVLWDTPAPAESPSPELDGVVSRALEKHPDDRFPSMAAFRETLVELSQRSDLESRSPSGWLGSLLSRKK